MAVRMFCDRCGKEIPTDDYVTFIINRHDEEPYESWEFCKDCALEVKAAMIRHIFNYQDNQSQQKQNP